MTIQQLNTKLESFVKELQGGDKLGNIMVGIGLEANKMIYDRVHGKGIDAEGSKYTPYSTKSMLSGCSNFIDESNCIRYIGTKAAQKKNRKRSRFEKYLAAEAGEFETKWITLKKAGKNIRLFEIPGGYREFRTLNKRQINYVDFDFTGDMWKGISLKINRNELNKGIVRIGAINPESEKKLTGNTKRRTDILKLNQTEINELSNKFENKLQELINKSGLG